MAIKSTDLKRTIRGISENKILIPIMHTALNDPSFQEFTITIPGWTARPYDGYFHPSTHSMWNTRQLALYLMAPELFQVERMELTSVFAITQGHFWHMFIQHVLGEHGILVEDELGFKDEEHRRTGHMDGLLAVKGEPEGLEIKTINGFKINKLVNETVLRETKPQYYYQTQEYLDVFGLQRMRYLVINPDYPFPMQEFVVNANPAHQAERRESYKRAIEIAGTHQMPLSMDVAGCCGTPSACPAAYACLGDKL